MFKVFKLTKNHLPEVKEIVTLEQMIPTEKIGHSIEILLPPHVSNKLHKNSIYVWATSTCPACQLELKELSNKITERNLELVLYILTTEPENTYYKINNNYKEVPLHQLINTAEMGELLLSSPCFFVTDEEKKLSHLSINHLSLLNYIDQT